MSKLHPRRDLTRNWSINGRFLAQSLTGVQRYAGEIVGALDREIKHRHPLAQGLNLQVLAPRGSATRIALEAIPTKEVGGGAGYAWEQLILPVHARGGLLSLGNVGPIAHRHHVVCMHDVTTRTCPESYGRAYRLSQAVIQPALARTAAAVVTVSRFSAAELLRHGLSGGEPPRVIANGHEHALGWPSRPSAKTRDVAGLDTIVMLGAAAPHKNVRLILGLSERVADAGLRVAIVGAADPRVFQVGAAAESRGLIWLGRLTDGEIGALLQDSLCLAFPSLTEGFGLPPLEAMALGCPVVASDRASLPEICGDAALYASPLDPEQWLEAFLTLRHRPAVRAAMVARGRAQALRFSWQQSARQYLALMAELDGVKIEVSNEHGTDVSRPEASPDAAEFDREMSHVA